METIRTFSTPVPVMPAVWPTPQRDKPRTTVRMPRKVQEPVRIGHYLEPLLGIASKPDRAEILQAFFSSGQ